MNEVYFRLFVSHHCLLLFQLFFKRLCFELSDSDHEGGREKLTIMVGMVVIVALITALAFNCLVRVRVRVRLRQNRTEQNSEQ